MKTLLVTFFAFVLVNCQPTLATTLNVPSEYPTIQSANAVAVHGDTILLAPGTYAGVDNRNIVVTQALTFIGNGAREEIVIDCGDTDKAFVLNWNVILRNITIVNARVHAITNMNGGIDMYNCVISNTRGVALYNDKWAHIYDSVMQGCYSTTAPSPAIQCFPHSELLLQNTQVLDNTTEGYGGAIWSDSAHSIVIDGCLFSGNIADDYGGAIYLFMGDITISNSVIANNESIVGIGGGLYVGLGHATLVGCTVTQNTGVSTHGPGINADVLTLDHTIVWGNIPGNDIRCDEEDFFASCSDYIGMPVYGDNISEDPIFCEPDFDNFMLDINSPCLIGPCGQIGAFGMGCEGGVATQETSWSSVKSMY